MRFIMLFMMFMMLKTVQKWGTDSKVVFQASKNLSKNKMHKNNNDYQEIKKKKKRSASGFLLVNIAWCDFKLCLLLWHLLCGKLQTIRQKSPGQKFSKQFVTNTQNVLKSHSSRVLSRLPMTFCQRKVGREEK